MTDHNPEDIAEARGDIETAILLALYASEEGRNMHREGPARQNGRGTLRSYEMGSFCPPKPEFPREAYAFDGAASAERDYAAHADYLVVDPRTAIGSGIETMMLCEDGKLKWCKVMPMPKPKGLVAITNKPYGWYVFHYRYITEGEPDFYVKRPFALCDDGSIPLLKALGAAEGYKPAREREEISLQLALVLSVFEDAHRAGSFLASVEEHVRLRFPVGQDAYKKFLILRDGPRDTPTGRKNPILHWCREHIRSTSTGFAEVETHLRGVEEVRVGPMRLTIEPNTGYARFMRPEARP